MAPDTTVDYEVGVKGDHFGINYSIDAYYIDWTNVQVNVATPTFGYYAVVNAKSAVSKGMEAELRGAPCRAASLGRWATPSPTPGSPPTSSMPDGSPTQARLRRINGPRGRAFLPGVPYSSVNLSLANTMNVAQNMTWTNRITGYYQSQTYNAVTPGTQYLTMDPFSLWGISSTLDWKSFEVSVFVKNLFNAKGVSGVFSQAYSGSDVAANFYGNDSRDTIVVPRTVGLSLGYKF